MFNLISNLLALNFSYDIFTKKRWIMAKMVGKWQAGQATVEYAIVAGVLVAVVAIMGLLLTTFGDYGERILEMIASDYP
jgi:hypothetical protein